MGEEITTSQFTDADYSRFHQHLEQETRYLASLFAEHRISSTPARGGFELEAWLVDRDLSPASLNEKFLTNLSTRLDSELASPELSSFNFEVNSTPRVLSGDVFSEMHDELVDTWQQCVAVAGELDARAVMIGILPTLQNEDLNLANMSRMQRYRALNREVVRMRRGKPMVLDINGVEHLKVTHRDVMLEAAATSFQIHLKLQPENALRMFNASMIMSGPMVALTANSPYLFGKDLWAESRIPVFEQAVAVGGYDGAMFGPIRRVSFGNGYIRDSLLECFTENLEHFPVLLPVELDSEPSTMSHLRLHNGTIWRWNRPLVGFDEDGKPHLRLEHRVVPAGPSLVDTMANAAFFYGVMFALQELPEPPEKQLEFDKARDNFYAAARHGMNAQQHWINGKQVSAHDLLTNSLLPMAYNGLQHLEISEHDITLYLGIIEQRLKTKMNGANWQRAYVKQYGNDMRRLTEAYLERQQNELPVHEWTL